MRNCPNYTIVIFLFVSSSRHHVWQEVGSELPGKLKNTVPKSGNFCSKCIVSQCKNVIMTFYGCLPLYRCSICMQCDAATMGTQHNYQSWLLDIIRLQKQGYQLRTLLIFLSHILTNSKFERENIHHDCVQIKAHTMTLYEVSYTRMSVFDDTYTWWMSTNLSLLPLFKFRSVK